MRSSRLTALAPILLAACSSNAEKVAVDSTAAAAPPAAAEAPAAPAMSLAGVAGTWDMVATPTAGDTVPTRITLVATADSTGWTMTYANRPPVKLHVRVDGDSLTMTSDPYTSFRRAGVKTSTTSVLRMAGDKLVGTTVAHYQTKGADSALTLRSEATKRP